MTAYFYGIATPPRVLSDAEQAALLRATGERRGAFRDHVLFALALGTGLREHELVALNVGDVRGPDGKPALRIHLKVFKRSARSSAGQVVVLSQTLRAKLERFLDWKQRHGESTESDAPLFLSRRRQRLSTRQVRHLAHVWSERAGLERPFNFHALRHAACSNVYRRTRDLRLTQLFGRHQSVLSTMRYSHPDETELLRALQEVRC
jgi:site-specific recombinase XerD